MRLMGKQLLMVISDGVDKQEVEQLRNGFTEENASIVITTPQTYVTVETSENGRRGADITIDIPFEAVHEIDFDGLVIPDGLLSTDMLRRDVRVIDLVFRFHQKGRPIFASGNAVQLLYDSQVLSHQIVIREGTTMSAFLDQAVGVLLDYPSKYHTYRPTMSS
jgi:putative intracellular protease/amidase